jgi:hypothetical protein
VHEEQTPPLLYSPGGQFALVKMATNPSRSFSASDVSSIRIIPVKDVTLDGIEDPLYGLDPICVFEEHEELAHE